MAQLVKNLPAMQETWVRSWVGKIPWRRERLPTPVFWPGEFCGLYSPWGCKELDMTETFTFMCYMGFPGGASGKEPACQCRRLRRCGFDPWVGKIPWREGKAWQALPVFLPGETHGQKSLLGYSPWGHIESDMTEAT